MQETKVSNSGTADSLLQVLDGSMSSSERFSGPREKIGGQGVLEVLGCLFVIVQKFLRKTHGQYTKRKYPHGTFSTCQVIDPQIFLGTRNPDFKRVKLRRGKYHLEKVRTTGKW